MFSMPNGRLFMGVQGEYNASGRFYNSYSAGVVGRYYIFNSNQWSAFAQSSFNVGRANYSNGGVQFFGGGVFNINTQAATSNFYSMEAGIGIQRRITKRLALEMLIDKPFILQQRNTKITSPYFSNLGTNFKPVAPQFKFGINYFFGK
jgi:hypothetical protein